MLERHGDRPDTPVDEPAPTITSKARSDVWVVDRRTVSRGAGGGRVPTVPVPMDRPAPTFTGKSGHQWCFFRPATTVCGDPRLSPPGYRGRPEDYDEDGEYQGKRSMDDAIKLTVSEALILQSFDPDYPVQGTRSKQFEQVGNAVPPLLAMRVLEAATDCYFDGAREKA